MVVGGFKSFLVLVLTITIAFLGDLKTSLLEIKPQANTSGSMLKMMIAVLKVKMSGD